MEKVFLLTLLLCVNYSEIATVCQLDTKTLGAKEPLFLRKKPTTYDLLVPTNGVLTFNDGDSFMIACTREPYTAGSINELKCKNGKFVDNDGKDFEKLRTYQCDAENSISAVRYPVHCSQGRGDQYDVGFKLRNGDFVRLYEVCHDRQATSTMYTSHTLHGSTIANHHQGGKRSNTFYTYALKSDVREFYYLKSQEITLEEVITVNQKKQLYLARGHLLPYSDMIFRSWQRATNTYLNVVPQWQLVNNGNWKTMEEKVQQKAANLGKDLKIVTGGIGELKMNNQQIKLSVDNNRIYAPKYMYKIVVNPDPARKEGIAFVVMNNPDATQNEPICEDICPKGTQHSHGWNFPSKDEGTKGFLICCTVADLKTKVTFPPDHLDDVTAHYVMSF